MPKKAKTPTSSPENCFDVRAWAKKATEEKKLRRRQSETLKFPAVCAAVEEVLTMMANGEVELTVGQLHQMLVDEFGYPLTESALLNYIYGHHKELWGNRNG